MPMDSFIFLSYKNVETYSEILKGSRVMYYITCMVTIVICL